MAEDDLNSKLRQSAQLLNQLAQAPVPRSEEAEARDIALRVERLQQRIKAYDEHQDETGGSAD